MGVLEPRPFLLRGLVLDPVTMDQAVETVLSWTVGSELKILSTPNASFLRLAQDDTALRRSILMSDLSTIDGMPLVGLGRALGVDVPGRVAGSDLIVALDARLLQEGRSLRVFFFGGREGAAKAAHENWSHKDYGLVSCGWLNPGFGSVDDLSGPGILSRINDADPDFLIVSLGAQKGQTWILQNRDQLNARIVSHLGAVVDFVAGGIRRSPVWVAKAGLEWLWRIKEEPMLWRRYAADAGTLVQSSLSLLGQSKSVSEGSGHQCSIEIAEESADQLTLRLTGSFDARSKPAWDAVAPSMRRAVEKVSVSALSLDCKPLTLMDVHGQAIALRALREFDGVFAQLLAKNIPSKHKASLNRNKFLDCLRLYQSDAAMAGQT